MERPDRKVTAAAIGGALATIIAWTLDITTGVTMPAAVVAAVTTLGAVVAGYFVRSADEGHSTLDTALLVVVAVLVLLVALGELPR